MRTLFETSWVRSAWSPNLGQTPAGTGNVFGDIATAAGAATKSYFDTEAQKEQAAAKEAQAKADIAKAQASVQAAAIAAANQPTILGMSPATAAIVGLLGVGAIIAVAMVAKKK